MKLLLHSIAVAVIQCGVYAWCSIGMWSEAWISVYYIWDKSVLLLLVLCCINPAKAMRPFWYVIGAFFVVRLLAEMFAAFVNVEKIIFDFKLLFLINLLCTALVIRNVLKCPKQ